jgi:serine/threonine-protein kinase
MGTVYRATDLTLERTVAVKVLAPALAEADPVHVKRFEREARAAASLAHPGIVAIFDTGVDDTTRFIVMEHVVGRSLAAIVRRQAPLAPVRAVKIAEQIAAALASAHAAGIVHRDIKPANVMVADDGSVKVLDFGLARALDGAPLTLSPAVLGTAAYMAPEQALGESADERSDVYALGCVLYAMLVGRPPFAGQAVAALIHQQINVHPRAPREYNRRVSPALERLVMQMLAKRSDERPQSSVEVRRRLGNLLAGTPDTLPLPAAREPDVEASAPTAATMPLHESVERASRSRMRPRAASVAAIAGVALLIAAIALTAGGGARRSPASRTQRPSASAQAPAHASRSLSASAAPSSTRAGAPSDGSPPVHAASRLLEALRTRASADSSAAGEPSAGRARAPGRGVGVGASMGVSARVGLGSRTSLGARTGLGVGRGAGHWTPAALDRGRAHGREQARVNASAL